MAIINKETIISAFDDKMTLLQWLKKLEKVLDTSTLVSIDTIKVANTKYKIVLSFEDGTKIESDIIQLQSEIAGINLVNGRLIFTLLNGDTIDAGLINVSNLGNTTIYGTFEVADGNATFGANVEVDGTLKVNSTLQVGDTTTNDEQLAKLPRALVLPVAPATEQELVGINQANEQNRLTIGDNLESVDGALKVVNKFEQKEANFISKEITFTSGGLTVETIYGRLEVINNILHVVVTVKVTNNTQSSDTVNNLNGHSIYLPPEYSSKIYDFIGRTVNQSTTTDNVPIACVHGIATKDVYALTDINFMNMVLTNGGSNTLQVWFRRVPSETSIVLEVGESLYVSGRMALTLI